jgi:hypothetical protein
MGSSISSIQNRKEGNSSDAAVTVRWAGISVTQSDLQINASEKIKTLCPACNVMAVTQGQAFHRKIQSTNRLTNSLMYVFILECYIN